MMRRFRSQLLLLWIGWTLLAGVAPTTTAAAESARPVRVRLEWGGGASRLWSGVVETRNARLENPVSLGIEADEPGTIWVDASTLWLRRRSVGVYDGFDVTVIGGDDAALVVTLQSTDPSTGERSELLRQRFEIRVADVTNEPRVTALGSDGTRLAVRRTPGDALTIQCARPHLIFEPREQFDARVIINVPPPAQSASASLRWVLRAARSGAVLQAGTDEVSLSAAAGALPSVPLAVPLPEREGVYDVELHFFGRGIPEESRTVQLVVIANAPPAIAAFDAADRVVDSFEPSRAGLFRRIERRNGFRPFNQSLGRLLGLSASLGAADQTSQDDSSVAWKAYRLQLKHPDQPHRLEVWVPHDAPQSVGISVLEPNAAGQLMPLGVDSGIAVRGDAHRSAGALLKHEILFWPRLREPILLLHDCGTGRPIDVAKVQVVEVGSLSPVVNGPALAADRPQRLIGPYLHKPYFPENFGAPEAYDAASRRSLDDWVTFQLGAERLVAYLKREGYNSLLLAVLADGSTIYPSRLLEPTPRYDTGAYFSTGQDPMRKDVLELLLRHFDRDGLALIPELQFSSPLPVLERALAQGHDSDRGIELIGSDGRSWREARGALRGRAPYYNPLNPRVQDAVLDVVRELVDRYARHPSFRGVALELSSVGYLQFPGLDWGYDDETIERFERATGVAVPSLAGRERFKRRHEFLTGRERERWVQWRCDELARFHRRLSDAVTTAGPNVRFILSATHLLRGGNADGGFEESVKSRGRFEDLLPERGLRLSKHADTPRFVALRPSLWTSPARPWENVMDDHANHNMALDAAFQCAEPGALFYHQPHECRVADFDSVSPWQPAWTWLAAQVSPGGALAREPLIHALATTDAHLVFEGGWTIPLGQEQETRAVREIVRALPAVPFHLAKAQQQPAVVRLAWHQGKTWCYVVNEMDGPIDVELQWSCAAAATYRLLPQGARQPIETREDGARFTRLTLPPYGMWACVVDDETARVPQVAVRLPDGLLASLDDRVQQFSRRIAGAFESAQKNERHRESLLTDPGFENTAAPRGTLDGWEPPVETAALWALDGDNPRSGKSSLMLISDGNEGASLSSAVPVNDSRLVTMSVWLRADRPDTEVRLVFEATVDHEVFRQTAELRADTRWRRYQFQVTDLPLRRWDDARMRVEIRGPGRIWIDDVDLQAQRLSPEDLRQLTRLQSAVKVAWEEKRYTDCARMMDSYWGSILSDASADQQPRDDATPHPPREASRLRSLFRR